MLLSPVHVQNVRDTWDWVLYAASLVAVIFAGTGALTWWTQLRRVPEVQFNWGHLVEGDWKPLVERPYSIRQGDPYYVRVVLVNVGTATPQRLIVNLIVPDFFQLRSKDRDGKERLVHKANEPAVHNPPTHGCNFVVARSEDFVPGISMLFYLDIGIPRGIKAPADHPLGHQYFIAVSAEAEGMTPTGRRKVPSIVSRNDIWNQEEWPGIKYQRRLRRVQAEPQGDVRCGPSKRLHRWPVEIEWASEGSQEDTNGRE